ncbi:MAG TPA: hypothetical protein VLJ86_25535 [Ramlibacter sp.]|nr:hypothetical protein [Ramlibacter sp.]
MAGGESARLELAEDFTEFKVVLNEDQLKLPSVLAWEGDQHAWVDEAWLRGSLARAHSTPDWEQKYAGMLSFARKNGWAREHPLSIRAHVVRRES